MSFDEFYKRTVGENETLVKLLPKKRLETMLSNVDVVMQEGISQKVIKFTHKHLPIILRPTPMTAAKFLLKPITAIDFKHVWEEARKQLHFKLEDNPEITTQDTKDGGMYATLMVQKDSLVFVLEIKLRVNNPDRRIEMTFKVIEDTDLMLELYRKEVTYEFPVEYDETGLALYGLAIYQ